MEKNKIRVYFNTRLLTGKKKASILLLFIYYIMNTFMNCKVFPFMTSSSCTEPPNEKRFEPYRRKKRDFKLNIIVP